MLGLGKKSLKMQISCSIFFLAPMNKRACCCFDDRFILCHLFTVCFFLTPHFVSSWTLLCTLDVLCGHQLLPTALFHQHIIQLGPRIVVCMEGKSRAVFTMAPGDRAKARIPLSSLRSPRTKC